MARRMSGRQGQSTRLASELGGAGEAGREERELHLARLATALEQTAESVIMTDPLGRIEFVNAAAERISGYSRQELLGRNPSILKSGQQSPEFYAQMWATLISGTPWTGDLVNRRKDGTRYVEHAVISPVRDGTGAICSFVAVQRDVTREREADSREERRARERALIAEALEDLQPLNTPDDTATAICRQIVRLPEFAFAALLIFGADGRAVPAGVAAGDGRSLGRHRIPLPRSIQLRNRAGEGPWVEAWTQPPSHPYFRILASLQVHALAYAPVRVGSALVGVLVVGAGEPHGIPELTERLPALLEFAAIGGALIGPGLSAQSALSGARSRMERVISRRAFRPVFQPIVELSTRRVEGYEGLTRFSDGVAPAERLAEATALGMGYELEMACLVRTLEAAVELPDGAWLNVNISPTVVLQGDRLGNLLRGQVRPLVLELTEHEAIEDYATFRSAVRALVPSARVAIDDAGAGFASFRHILELRPDLVKLDRSLVTQIDEDPVRQALVAGISYFAESARCDLVAEGIETEDELETLRLLGVKMGQGYYFAAPLPVAELSVSRPARARTPSWQSGLLGTALDHLPSATLPA